MSLPSSASFAKFLVPVSRESPTFFPASLRTGTAWSLTIFFKSFVVSSNLSFALSLKSLPSRASLAKLVVPVSTDSPTFFPTSLRTGTA